MDNRVLMKKVFIGDMSLGNMPDDISINRLSGMSIPIDMLTKLIIENLWIRNGVHAIYTEPIKADNDGVCHLSGDQVKTALSSGEGIKNLYFTGQPASNDLWHDLRFTNEHALTLVHNCFHLKRYYDFLMRRKEVQLKEHHIEIEPMLQMLDSAGGIYNYFFINGMKAGQFLLQNPKFAKSVSNMQSGGDLEAKIKSFSLSLPLGTVVEFFRFFVEWIELIQVDLLKQEADRSNDGTYFFVEDLLAIVLDIIKVLNALVPYLPVFICQSGTRSKFVLATNLHATFKVDDLDVALFVLSRMAEASLAESIKIREINFTL